MAYVIGSQKGKDIAENMKTGETYTASDGSTWTKKSDGSVSVTHNGQTYDNAYKSSGSSSGGNSQYTNLGSTYNANTDYQAIINDAVARGDYATAAQAEQLRNQKITATGSNHNTTNMYAGYLDNNDYGTIGQQQIANGASWRDVLDTYNSRYNKALKTEGLDKYANDEIQQMMWNYIIENMQGESQQNATDQFNQWVEDYNQANPKEEYNSKYDPQIDAILNEILNRDDFSYDVANDPLYQQYADMYRREGDRAMRDTLAEVAAGAGGMNTYAVTAAMQANNYYNSQLNDKIPELYQLAYDMYLNDKESKVQDLGILQNMDATQYGRYRDTITDWYNDKNFAYGAYLDGVQQGNWQTNYDYNATIGDRNFNYNDYWKNKDFNYTDMWANKEWDANQAEKERDWAIEAVEWAIDHAVMPSAEDIQKSGLSEEGIKAAVQRAQDALATNVPVTVASRANRVDAKLPDSPKVDKDKKSPTDIPTNKYTASTTSPSSLGIGPVNESVIQDLVLADGVVIDANGNYSWAAGWNSGNYQTKLNEYKASLDPISGYFNESLKRDFNLFG